MGVTANDEHTEEIIEDENIEERAAGAPEGTPPADPTSAEVKSLYEDLGIKAPVPTGATKGRPKSNPVRTEDNPKKDAGNSVSKRQEGKDAGDEDDSKPSPDSTKGSGDGNKTDPKGTKDNEEDKSLQDEPGEADKGVHDSKSRSEEDSERGREDDPKLGTPGDEPAKSDEDGEEEGEPTDEEGVKRPGKSNPAVEQRFQKLTAELKARDELIEKQAKQLEETQRKQFESKIAQEDPEYTVEDFKKVRDEDGQILELDENQAELAFRRWQDGFNQRKSEREAQFNRETAIKEYQENAAAEVMRSSVEAYDTLTGLLSSYPELSSKNPDGSKNPDFDEEFSNEVMPIIEDAIIYKPGTEPGNEENYKPVIIGLRIDPTKILKAMNAIKSSKRTLPLNGTHDNVESRSNVNVPHSRSSDPTVNAANELYKELGINKRI